MVDESPRAVSAPWMPGQDLLILFTDGMSDARDRFGARFGEGAVLDVVREYRAESPAAILERVFRALGEHTGDAIQRDDQTCLVLRS
jgi:serine phosphatase RsbU (regulator of sigma subunit)